MRKKVHCWLLLGFFACLRQAAAQGTLFTYQGSLKDGGLPANGGYDLQFYLRDALVAGHSASVTNRLAPVAVNNGLFTVTLDFGPGIFTGTNYWLEMGVRTNGSQAAYTILAPRQAITATPYAITAGSVSGPLNGGSVIAGSITGTQLAPGAAAANLNAAGQGGVASGGVVLSVSDNPALAGAGYVKLGTLTTPDTWQQRGTGATPIARHLHSAVWTGTDMIVWGGIGGGAYLNDGGRYNPTTNSWRTVTTTGAPSGRYAHTAVWTGAEMIIWGGANSAYLYDGGVYNPVTDSWRALSTTAGPSARYVHTAVWTGTEMIVWGGYNGNYLNDGGRYNPATSTWAPITTSGAPANRSEHTAVWTGTEMIIWGGRNTGTSTIFGDGARYNPTAKTWTPVTGTGAPGLRYAHTAVWTGTEMIVWGGLNGSNLNDGGRYNPATNGWTAVTTNGAPAARYAQTAVWTGAEMVVWGGYNGVYLNDAGRYSPATATWVPVSAFGAPAARGDYTAIWTGTAMLVFGGYDGTSLFNDTWSYTPGRVMVLYQRP